MLLSDMPLFGAPVRYVSDGGSGTERPGGIGSRPEGLEDGEGGQEFRA